MSRKRKAFVILILCAIFAMSLTGVAPSAYAAEPIAIYTPYTNISVTPGESIDYTIDLINNTDEIQTFALQINNLPEGWEYKLTSSGWSVHEIAVKPEDSRTVSLQVDVPLRVNKGTYTFQVTAPGKATLPLTVHVTEQGTFKTELTTEQPNMEGHADSTFRFNVELRNRTAEEQLYALTANAPRGWDVQFTVDGKSVTSVNAEANTTKDIDITIVPPEQVKEGSYKIPVKASTSSTSAEVELEVVITGTYNLELTTPQGLLSTDITAGDEKKLTLQVKNTGTADLSDINLRSNTPIDWEVTFEPNEIKKLPAGQTTEVVATIKADKKAIAGDYVVEMSATTPEASADAQFRVSVKTSLLWGWIGILIILAVVGGIYYLFQKYGRR